MSQTPSPATGATPPREPVDFFITISVRSERPKGAPAEADGGERLLWGGIQAPRPGYRALATMGHHPTGKREIMVCYAPGQERLAESGIGAASFHSRRLALDLDAERPFAIPVCLLRGRLAPGRGFLLAEPFAHEPGALGETPPRWAIPLWPSEMELLAKLGSAEFLARALAAGVDFLDWRRDSLFGEKAPEEAEDEAAEAALTRVKQAEREAAEAKARAEADTFQSVRAAPFGMSIMASQGLSEACGFEAALLARQGSRREALACASLLGGFLKAESPRLATGFRIGPYGELPGAPGKRGFYFCAIDPDLARINLPQGLSFLRVIALSAKELEAAESMPQDQFEALLLGQGEGLLDLDRPCLFGSDAEPSGNQADASRERGETDGSEADSEAERAKKTEAQRQAQAARALAVIEDEREMQTQERLREELRAEMAAEAEERSARRAGEQGPETEAQGLEPESVGAASA